MEGQKGKFRITLYRRRGKQKGTIPSGLSRSETCGRVELVLACPARVREERDFQLYLQNGPLALLTGTHQAGESSGGRARVSCPPSIRVKSRLSGDFVRPRCTLCTAGPQSGPRSGAPWQHRCVAASVPVRHESDVSRRAAYMCPFVCICARGRRRRGAPILLFLFSLLCFSSRGCPRVRSSRPRSAASRLAHRALINSTLAVGRTIILHFARKLIITP